MYKISIGTTLAGERNKYRAEFEKQFIKTSLYYFLVNKSCQGKDYVTRWKVGGYAEPLVHREYLKYIEYQELLKQRALEERLKPPPKPRAKPRKRQLSPA